MTTYRGRRKLSSREVRNFRTFLLVQQFAAREIGERIAQARREAGGMTQQELADLLDVTMRSVQAYEAGDVVPWRHFSKLGEIFKKPLAWFLHGEDQAPTAGDASVGERLDRIERVLEELVARLEPPAQQDQAGSEDV